MFKKRKKETYSFDTLNQKPIIKRSMYTGEKVAGFKDIRTGKFTEVMLIKDDRDLKAFKENYNLGEMEIHTEY